MTTLGAALAVGATLADGLRGVSQLHQCQDRLRQFGQLSGIVAAEDGMMTPHRQSTVGRIGWRGLGSWDWGGADGHCGETRSDWTAGYPYGYGFGFATRPYNIARFGSPVPPNSDFSAFSCPSDTGADENLNYTPAFASLVPCTSEEADGVIHDSVYQAFGTSFQGDFLWLSGPDYNFNPSALRFGSFGRPLDRIPKPGESLLFWELRMAQAYLSSDEFINGGGASSGGNPVAVPSWHAPDGFNALFVDGHAQNLVVNVTGSVIRPDSFDPNTYPLRGVMLRGQGWRYDAFTETLVIELTSNGDPFPQSSVPNGPIGLQTRAQFLPPP